jgi:hypothetical protein
VTVVDDRDNEQRQAHRAGTEHHGIHGRYDRPADHQFVVEIKHSPCKHRSKIRQKSRTEGAERIGKIIPILARRAILRLLTSPPKVCKLVKLVSGGSA